MKKLVSILFTVFLIGCANVSEEKSVATSDMTESEVTEDVAPLEVEEAFPFATITEQKLQEYFDLLALKNKHPELTETIATQLKLLSKDSIALPKGQDAVAIRNMIPLGPLVKINDTLQEQSFLYTIVSKSMVKTDTLTAQISRKPIQIEGVETLATKVIFRKKE